MQSKKIRREKKLKQNQAKNKGTESFRVEVYAIKVESFSLLVCQCVGAKLIAAMSLKDARVFSEVADQLGNMLDSEHSATDM